MHAETDRKTVLIVDDEAIVRRFCQRVLTQLGYHVLYADKLEEALRQIQSNHLDLLITDLRLPDGDGKDVLQQFHKKFPRTKAIVMTGLLHPEDRLHNNRERNASELIQKPFQIEDLETAVYRCLG